MSKVFIIVIFQFIPFLGFGQSTSPVGSKWSQVVLKINTKCDLISTLLSSITHEQTVDQSLAMSLKNNSDSMAILISKDIIINKLILRKVEVLNYKMDSLMTKTLEGIENDSSVSNLGNIIRIVSLYKRNQSELNEAAKDYNISMGIKRSYDKMLNLGKPEK